MAATPTSGVPPHRPDGADPTVAQFRHRREVPMLVMGGTLSALGLLVYIGLLAAGDSVPGWLSAAVLAMLAAPLLLSLFFIRYNYWQTASNGVEAGPDQFPEVYEIFHDNAARMRLTDPDGGMTGLPKLYVVNGNGIMNAYATKCQLSRAYVVIYSDLVDIAYEHGDFTALRFVLAHELGHIKCRHVSIWRSLLQPVARLLFLQPSISRAQEYTADRVGSYYAPEGVMGLMSVIAGKRMYRHLDLDAYFRSVEQHKDGFWLKFANFRADHPVGFRRMTTLRRITREGWDVHGSML